MVRTGVPTIGSLIALAIAVLPVWSEFTQEDVRSGNAASQAAVATVQARVEVTIHFPPSVVASIPGSSETDKYVLDYVRSGDKERVKEIQGPLGVRDIIRDFGNKKGSLFVPQSGGKSVDTAILGNEQTPPVTMHIWEWVLFELPECKAPLSQLLDMGDVKKLKSTEISGRALIYLDVRLSKDQRYELWVDPAVNYLVRKLIYHTSKPKVDLRVEKEVLSFREVQPGVFFPEQLVHGLFFSGGQWFEKAEATLTNIRVNEPLPEGQFRHTFPPGTMVTDYEKGQAYIVSPEGQPRLVSPLDPSGARAPEEVMTQTPVTADDDPWPWHRILVLVSVVAVVCGLSVTLWKRLKTDAGA